MAPYYGPVPYESPAKKERYQRSRERWRFARQGRKYPRLKTIGCVELDKLTVPDWARRKAVKGLEITATKVWLRRIDARSLAKQDRAAGGEPLMTLVNYRVCRHCLRPLLGIEAEARYELDKQEGGHMLPCDSECFSIQADRFRSMKR